jgi:predicted nicotinamide N-methyase
MAVQGWITGSAWLDSAEDDDDDAADAKASGLATPPPPYRVSASGASAELARNWRMQPEPEPEPEPASSPRAADLLAQLSELEGGNSELHKQQQQHQQQQRSPEQLAGREAGISGRSDWKLFHCERRQIDGEERAQLVTFSQRPLSRSDSTRRLDEGGFPSVAIVKPGAGTVLQHGDYGRRVSASAEALAFYACAPKQQALLQNKRVLEIGAGLGLPGLAVATWTDAESVDLTDGDPVVVQNLQQSIQKNHRCGSSEGGGGGGGRGAGRGGGGGGFGGTRVNARQLDWEVPSAAVHEEEELYDIVLASDTVGHRLGHDSHSPLLSTVRRWLKPNGLVLFMASRDYHLEQFMQAANQGAQAFGFVGQSLEYDGSSAFRGMKCGPVLIRMTNPRVRPHQEFRPPAAAADASAVYTDAAAAAGTRGGRDQGSPSSTRQAGGDGNGNSRSGKATASRRRRKKNQLRALKGKVAAAAAFASPEPSTQTATDAASTTWSPLGSTSLPDLHASAGGAANGEAAADAGGRCSADESGEHSDTDTALPSVYDKPASRRRDRDSRSSSSSSGSSSGGGSRGGTASSTDGSRARARSSMSGASSSDSGGSSGYSYSDNYQRLSSRQRPHTSMNLRSSSRTRDAITAECTVLSYTPGGHSEAAAGGGGGGRHANGRGRKKKQKQNGYGVGADGAQTVFRLMPGGNRSKLKYVVRSRRSASSVLEKGALDNTSTCYISTVATGPRVAQEDGGSTAFPPAAGAGGVAVSLRFVPGFPHRQFKVVLDGRYEDEITAVCDSIRGTGFLLLSEGQAA